MSLRQLRIAAGLTQSTLAFLLSVNVATVSSWENGATEPRATQIRKLAWALRVSETDVLEAICGVKQTA